MRAGSGRFPLGSWTFPCWSREATTELGATVCGDQLLSGHMGFAEEGLSGVVGGREGISQGRWEVRLGLGWGQGNEEKGQRVESSSWGRVARTWGVRVLKTAGI